MNIEEVRKYFPVVDELIYLDHAGVAPLSTRVVGAVEGFLQRACEGGGIYTQEFDQEVERVRDQAACVLGAHPDEIAFAKNTSEALSWVAAGINWSPQDNVIINDLEFPSNVYPWMNLKEIGVELKTISAVDGRITPEMIESQLDSRTRLVALSSVQYQNGFRANLEQIGKICRERGIFFCVDGIQSVGAIPLDVHDEKIDFLAADGHKWMLAPEGVAIFYCRRENLGLLKPLSVGWKSVAKPREFDRIDFTLRSDAARFEGGSLNIMGIFAFGSALDLLIELGIEWIYERILTLTNYIYKEAQEREVPVLSPWGKGERSGIVSLKVQDPKFLHRKLLTEKIVTAVRGNALRLSPHFYNTEAEIQQFFETLEKLTAKKQQSPSEK